MADMLRALRFMMMERIPAISVAGRKVRGMIE